MPTASRPAIFLSSTVQDLQPFREVVIHVCRRLGIDVVAMEDFGPDPRTAAETCRAKVESADLFVGLYAHRYGFQPEGFGGKSITELEYDWAVSMAVPLPVLLFAVDQEQPWPTKWVDHDEPWKRLEAFRKLIRQRHVVAELTTPEMLRDDLFIHLPAFRDRADLTRPRPAPAVVLLPQPPEPYLAHQYTLLQTDQVIGRDEEQAELDAWASDPRSARLLSVVAIGGVGKSALIWKWFHDRAPAATALAGRFWWSFYEPDAGFDRFVVAALAYCGRQSIESVEAMSPVDREWQLLAVLDREPFLLVLDGLERILMAYANLDFAHLSDEDLDERTANAVAGALGLPPEVGETFVGRHRLRQTIDPRAGEFLKKLAGVRSSRTLISTRLYPAALQTVTGQALRRTRAWFLQGLSPGDALHLWRAMGVTGDDTDLLEFFQAIDHYPLLIRALAGEVADYRRAPGDFDGWRQDHPDFNPFTLSLVQAKSHVLAYALGDLGETARKVLNTIAAFRSPVDYGTLGALFIERNVCTAIQLDGALTELEDRGLLGWDRGENRYDLHPIVRGVVWNGLDDLAQRAVYGELEQHFHAVAGDQLVKEADEANGVIELFTSLVGLTRYNDACRLYMERLHNSSFSFAAAGMNHVRIALLESLFPAGLEEKPHVQADYAFAVMAQLGYGYDEGGRLNDALMMAGRSLAIAPLNTRYLHLAQVSKLKRGLGRLRESIEAAKEAAVANPYDGAALGAWALGVATTGRATEALKLLRDRNATRTPEVLWCKAQIRLWLGNYEGAEKAARRLAPEYSRDLWTDSTISLVLGEAALGRDRFDEAGEYLMHALRTSRAMGLIGEELRSLRCLAELYRLTAEYSWSRSMLDDLAEPAARGPYRLVQADAANVRAALEIDLDNREAAVAAARDAYDLSRYDVSAYAYHWGLRRAVRRLEVLDAEL